MGVTGACFVVTACYGSYDAPTVLAFSQFRDNHLAQYELGRRFISWYYMHGPSWARAIDNKPGVKAILRVMFKQLAKILPGKTGWFCATHQPCVVGLSLKCND